MTNSMPSQPSQLASSLSEKYEILHLAFTDLASQTAQFHSTMDLQDPSIRGLFNSLSRIMAFADHIHVALNLMGEDVHSIEAAYGDPMREDWTEELQECFDEWFTNLSVSNTKVN